MDFNKLSHVVNAKVIFDGRNMFRKDKLSDLGWQYINIGEKNTNAQ